MAIEAVFQNLVDKFAALQEALESLRLTAVEDRPLRDEVLLVDRLANTIDDLQGWVKEAAEAAGRTLPASRHPFDAHRLREALSLANNRFIQLEYKFLSETISHDEINELSLFGLRRGREWLGWTGSVIQALDQCRAPLRELDEALLLCWRELCERLGLGSVLVQTTNIGQQISGAAAAARTTRDGRSHPQDAMT